MAENRGNALPDSEFVPTAEMMEDMTRASQNSFRSIMEGKDIEDTFALRDTDPLSFHIGMLQLFLDNFERIKMGSIEIMEFCIGKFLYSIPDADDEVHRTMESSRKQLRMVVVGMEVLITNDRGEASRERDQQPENRRRTLSDSESLYEDMRDVLEELETSLINSSLVTSQGKEIEVTRELRDNIKKAVRDSYGCLAVDKKVEETCELRETNPWVFKAGIIIHFLANLMRMKGDVFKIEEFCRNKDVLRAVSFAEDQLYRDMDSARKGIEKIVGKVSAMKKNLGKAPDSLVETTSVREALR